MARFHRTGNSGDVDIPDGAELSNVHPLDEYLYDREVAGPMYAVEAPDGRVFHLFADEIQDDAGRVT